VPKLIAVAALDVGRVEGLSALLGDMTFLTAVAASTAAAALGAVAREVAN